MTNVAPEKSRAREWLGMILLCLYVALILMATIWPTPLDRGYESSIQNFLKVLHRTGVPEWFGYSKLEFSGNVLLFVPLGFLVALILPQSIWWLALVLCPVMSIAIELTQWALLSARFGSLLDVVANSAGAIIGILLAIAIRAITHERDQKLIARALWTLRSQGPRHRRPGLELMNNKRILVDELRPKGVKL